MRINLIKILVLSVALAACGSRIAPEGNKVLPSTDTGKSDVGQGDEPEPLKLPDDAPADQIHPNFLYPVTLCGGVGASAKVIDGSEYRVQNGSLVVYLKTSSQEVMDRLRMLNGIFPSSADGCVHGRHLPVSVDGRLVFEVETESVSIASGGFSVSN